MTFQAGRDRLLWGTCLAQDGGHAASLGCWTSAPGYPLHVTTDLLLAQLEVELRALRPLTAKSPHQLVAEQLRQHISLGWWPAGHPLPAERELAADLRVSRETVRQAVQLLAAEGHVTPRGPRVPPRVAPRYVDREQRQKELRSRLREFEDLHALREVIEVHGARQAARERATEHLALMTKAQGGLRTALIMKAPDQIRAADTDFHLAVAAASGNHLLPEEVRRIRSTMFLALDELSEDDGAQSSLEEHERILEAIQAGAESDAAKWMADHLAHTGEEMLRLLGSE